MPTLQVDTLTFTFTPAVTAQLYDKWQHYTAVWNAPGGRKAVDVVAVEGAAPPTVTWLIEAKDFRIITNPPKGSNIGGLAQFVADKVSDTQSGLADAAINAANPAERSHAANAVASTSVRIVLHLEPHVGAHTALFPTNFAAGVYQSLKQLVQAIDPNPLVLNVGNTAVAGVPWAVA
jgi:hypothetical protein